MFDGLIYRNAELFLAKGLDRLPNSSVTPAITDFNKDHRFVPPGISEYPGMFDPSLAPHLIEPTNSLHPDAPFTHIFIMKSVQSAVTTTVAEGAIGFYMYYGLGSIIYYTASKEMAGISSSYKIDTLIDNTTGLAAKFKPISNRVSHKKADNTYYKEYAGGNKILITSYNASTLKQNTFHLNICDEFDEAPLEWRDQGNIRKVMEGRTMGLRHYKMLFISTPTRMDSSLIYAGFLEGDQRICMVPCPLCGELQPLIMRTPDIDYGLTFLREKDKYGVKRLIPESVVYICQYCKRESTESKKQAMLLGCSWKPTVIQQDPKKISYQLNSLYSPTPFLPWLRVCQALVDTDYGHDVLKYKDYMINFMGKPWARMERIIDYEELRNRALDYCYGEVPPGKLQQKENQVIYHGAVILFGGVDVQKDRLELHVLGFGVDGHIWSVDYQIFYGDTAKLENSCWNSLSDFLYSHTYNILGKQNYIALTGVDCAYAPNESGEHMTNTVVYDFVALRQNRCIAIMGESGEKVKSVIQETRVHIEGSLLKKRYNVYASIIKDVVMRKLSVKNNDSTIHFPKYMLYQQQRVVLPDEHFQQMMSERYQELKPNKFGWKQTYKRNEVWDTFIYAYATADFYGVNRWSTEQWQLYYENLIAIEGS